MARLRETTDDGSPAWYEAQWAARERIETEAWGSGPLPRSGSDSRDELMAAGMDAAMTDNLADANDILEVVRSNVENDARAVRRSFHSHGGRLRWASWKD